MDKTNTPVAELLFSAADATPISTDETTIKPWSEASDQLAAAPKYWLATGRLDGRPHVMPVLGVWLKEAIHVATRPSSRKGKNLANRADCVITVSTETVDLAVECVASEIIDDPGLSQVADTFEVKYGLYRLVPRLAFGFGPDGMTATRWRF